MQTKLKALLTFAIMTVALAAVAELVFYMFGWNAGNLLRMPLTTLGIARFIPGNKQNGTA